MANLRLITLIGYEQFYNEPYRGNPIDLLKGLSVSQAMTSLCNLSNKYFTNQKGFIKRLTTFQTQIEVINFFLVGATDLEKKFTEIANKPHYTKVNSPVLLSRYAILYAIELLHQNRPKNEYVESQHEINNTQALGLFKLLLHSNNIVSPEGIESKQSFIESLAPRILMLNEVESFFNPIVTMANSIAFFRYMSDHKKLSKHFEAYIRETYSLTSKNLWKEINVLFSSETLKDDFRSGLIPKKGQENLFLQLSNRKSISSDPKILINIRKNPVLEIRPNQFKVINHNLLLDKLFYQIIHDFWFDYIKRLNLMKAKNYFATIGDFAEERLIYIAKKNLNTKGLKFYYGKDLTFDNYEICDLLIKIGNKLIMIEVKGALFTESQKFSGTFDKFLGENIKSFKEKFGVHQLEKDLDKKLVFLKKLVPNIDLNRHEVYRLAVNLEKGFSAPIMPTFMDQFMDQTQIKLGKTVFHPIKITTLYEFEILFTRIRDEPNSVLINILRNFSSQKMFDSFKLIKPLLAFVHSPNKVGANNIYLKEEIRPYID
jgi:hypothetical protein